MLIVYYVLSDKGVLFNFMLSGGLGFPIIELSVLSRLLSFLYLQSGSQIYLVYMSLFS